MPNVPGKDYFSGFSRKLGFRTDNLEKVFRLCLILDNLKEFSELSGTLALKGGTAIQGLEFGFSRLSVDIDLNYVGNIKKDAMLDDRSRIRSVLVPLLKDLEYGVEESGTETYALEQFFLNYTNCLGIKDSLKVEINYLERLPVLGNLSRELITPFEDHLGTIKVRSYRSEELFAGKLRALITRCSARDIYDAHKISLRTVDLDYPLFRKTTLFYLAMQKEDVRKMMPWKVDSIDKKSYEKHLIPMLSRSENVDYDMICKNSDALAAGILKIDPIELEFFNRYYDEGSVRPDLLFNGFEVAPNLDNHPSIQWILHGLNGKI